MASYYRRCVKRFSKLASPIAKLLHESNKFKWTEECENNFQVWGFVIYNDAFKKGLAHVLM